MVPEGVDFRLSKKLRVVVLFGGKSEEHQVSMMSAKAVLEALSSGPYELIPVAISREGKWNAGRPALDVMRRAIGSAPEALSLSLTSEEGEKGLLQLFQAEAGSPFADVVIPMLHGPFGEDGSVQGLLELAGIAYVGSGVLGSALGMDKVAMKTMLGAHGIAQVGYHGFSRGQWRTDRQAVLTEIERKLPYPIFVKPANLGSSVGVSKAGNRERLEAAIELAQHYDRRLIAEEGVDAREFEVGILGSEAAEASVVGEVKVQGHDFYDYDAKYGDQGTVMTIPANIPGEVSEPMRAMAIRAFHALDLAGLARVDFFWERQTGRILLNEVNTLPGFTPFSMYPVLWQASGVSYASLLDRLIILALDRD